VIKIINFILKIISIIKNKLYSRIEVLVVLGKDDNGMMGRQVLLNQCTTDKLKKTFIL
jgi:hypothetical protein